jgi:SRSO17 transposase
MVSMWCGSQARIAWAWARRNCGQVGSDRRADRNCQLGVFLAYATSKGRTLLDRELYLPRSWIADRSRCRATAVPDEVEFATKTVLAQQMLDRLRVWPGRWLAAPASGPGRQ